MTTTSIGSSGPLRFSTLKNVFGTSGPVRFSTFKRDNVYVPNISANTNIPTTYTNLQLKKFYNTTVVRTITLPNGNTETLNLLTTVTTTFGTLNTAKKYVKLVIPAGAVVGTTNSAVAALDIGQFPTGTIIEIENNGSIQGAGGLAGAGGTVYGAAANTTGGPYSGGKGGDAIKADYSNQTVTITNNGTIYAGGGGGGGGAKGAPGGAGTNGVKPGTFIFNISGSYPYSYWRTYNTEGAYTIKQQQRVYLWYGGANGYYDTITGNDSYITGTYTSPMFRGNFVQQFGPDVLSDGVTYRTIKDYYIAQEVSSLGGVGGAGGNGGAGAKGRGYNNTTLTGSSGIVGSAGTGGEGGTATAGGTGNTGVSGGNGGAFGASGTASTAGAGTAGYYLVKGSASVTLIGGTTAGLLA
jgi:hypothetical protein